MTSLNVIIPELSTTVQITKQHKMLMMEHYLKKRKQDAEWYINYNRNYQKFSKAVGKRPKSNK